MANRLKTPKLQRMTFACNEDFVQRLNTIVEQAHQKRSTAVFKMVDAMLGVLETTRVVGTYDFDFLLEEGKKAMISSVQRIRNF